MGELAWYVVRAVSGQEKKVKTYLDTEIERQKIARWYFVIVSRILRGKEELSKKVFDRRSKAGVFQLNRKLLLHPEPGCIDFCRRHWRGKTEGEVSCLRFKFFQ